MASETRQLHTRTQWLVFLGLPLACFLLGAGVMLLCFDKIHSFGTTAATPTAAATADTAALPVFEDVSREVLLSVFDEMQATIDAPTGQHDSHRDKALSRFLSSFTRANMAMAAPSTQAPPSPVVAMPVMPPANAAPRLSIPAHASTAQQGIATQPNTPSQQNTAPPRPPADIFASGTLGQMTQLRAELEQLKLQVSIEETRARLNQLRSANSAPEARRQLPSLDYPPIGMPDAPSRPSLRILSIQSVNGHYSATVGTPSGPRVVRVNDHVGGGRVVSITRGSVVINRGHGNETLTIQD